jgi:hypothetical protein
MAELEMDELELAELTQRLIKDPLLWASPYPDPTMAFPKD